VALDVEQVAAMGLAAIGALGMPEVIEAGPEHGRQRREARDVSAKITAIGRVKPVRLTTIAIAFQRM